MAHSIGKTIAELRKEKGWTQIELAEKLQVSDKAISKWEQEGGIPSVEFFPVLAEIFGVSIDYLMTGKKVDNVNLEDMDATKRLAYLIEKDDVDNFKKYNSKVLSVTKSGYNTLDVDLNMWKEIIEKKAHNIFNYCCDEILISNVDEHLLILYLYGFIDEFIKMIVDVDRQDILEFIGFNVFTVGYGFPKYRIPEFVRYGANKIRLEKRGYSCNDNILSIYDYKIRINDMADCYAIKEDTIEYIFANRNNSPKCFNYLLVLEFKRTLESYPYKGKVVYCGSNISSYINKYLVKYKLLDLLKNRIDFYNEKLNSPELNKYTKNAGYVCSGTYIQSKQTNYDRGTSVAFNLYKVYCFGSTIVKELLKVKQVELAKELNAFDKKVSAKLQELGHEGISVMTDSEIERFLLLNSDISENEKAKIRCVKDNILQVYEIKQLEDLKLAREIINSGYYNHFELVCSCYKKDCYRELFEFLVDNNHLNKAESLLTTKGEQRVKLLIEIFNLIAMNGDVKVKIEELEREAERNFSKIRMTDIKQFRLEKDKYCIEKMYDYILEQKELLYKHVKDKVDAKAKAEQDAKDRAKIIMDLDNAHFSELIARNEIRLFVLDLCSLFDAILKFDYKIEGEDFFARMTKYFDNGPKRRYCDDGWGYSVVDSKYEREEVIPWQAKRELFNRLRIQRNNIAHSESNKVQELTLQELADCLEFVFSLKKEIK